MTGTRGGAVTAAPFGPVAPRCFWTFRGAERWAAEHNPWLPGTERFYLWRHAFWQDQSDRSGRRSLIALVVAVISSVVSLICNVLHALGHS